MVLLEVAELALCPNTPGLPGVTQGTVRLAWLPLAGVRVDQPFGLCRCVFFR